MRHEIVCPNPDAQVNFHFSRDRRGGYVTPHWHNSLEFLYVLEGCITVEFHQKRVPVYPGEFIVINSAQVHSVSSEPNEALVLQVPMDLLKKYVDDYELMTFEVDMHPENAGAAASVQSLKDIFLEMYEIYEARPEGYLLKFHSLVYQLLFELVRSYSHKKVRSEYEADTRYLSRLDQMKQYLDDHHGEHIRIRELAELLGYNEDYISRLFKKYMGMSIITYLYEIRISYVLQDLVHTDLSIQDIFERHGCYNVKLAKRLFREHYHGTPRDVRRYLKGMDPPE